MTSARRRRRFTHRFGPTAVVTGASSGIGRAIAVELGGRGMDLVLVARREPLLDALAAELRTQHGVAVDVLPLDLTDATAATTLLERTAHHDVGLYVAAAGFGTSGPFLEADLDKEVEMLRLNTEAVMTTTHGFARRMAARGSGGIVLLSSVVAFQGVPRAAHYAATKAYVQTFAEGLRPELRAQGVELVAVAPGPVHSGFAERSGMTITRAVTARAVAAPALDALGRRGVVAPGTLSRVLTAVLSPLPRRVRTTIMAGVMKGMTPDGGGGRQRS
ncbi:SDR family NAD(P)-dependent oxidoreductase [Oryzobacter telluris]|uniref:SDR family NAD(P)-dependent oxidoreductase n=1 Tax=Oryzobacter telluris TaxID=3149179 RepID=UPI00370D570E